MKGVPFVAAGAFNVVVSSEDVIHLLFALSHANIAGATWADPLPASESARNLI